MSKGTVLILGGRSDIGLAIAHRFAAHGYRIQLAARHAERLAPDKANIELRYNVVATLHEFDVLETKSHQRFVSGLGALPDIAICSVGILGIQAECERDQRAATLVMRSNYEGPALILAVLAEKFDARGRGTLVGISSVAGERGRATNYVYGSAKAGLTAFLSGLRNRLAKNGVHVVTVLPGFVATKMTEGMELPRFLTAEPEEVAAAVVKAVHRRRNVIYVKPVWQLVMLIIRCIPEGIFKMRRI